MGYKLRICGAQVQHCTDRPTVYKVHSIFTCSFITFHKGKSLSSMTQFPTSMCFQWKTYLIVDTMCRNSDNNGRNFPLQLALNIE